MVPAVKEMLTVSSGARESDRRRAPYRELWLLCIPARPAAQRSSLMKTLSCVNTGGLQAHFTTTSSADTFKCTPSIELNFSPDATPCCTAVNTQPRASEKKS